MNVRTPVNENWHGPLGLKDKEGIDDLIRETCNKAGMPEAFDIIKWKFSGRLTTTLGHAHYYFENDTGEIDFCFELWGRANYEQRREVIIHETVHILVFKKYGPKDSDKHGPKWKAMMVQCGGNPTPYHEVCTKGVKRTQKRYLVECRCTKHEITQNKLTRMRNGRYRRCLTCNHRLDPETAVLQNWWMYDE